MFDPENNVRHGYKVLTSQFRPPIQGGEPLFDGKYPFTTPEVKLDRSKAECGNGGWHYCKDLATAFKLAGIWSDGHPSQAIQVVAAKDAIERGTKRRASSLTFQRAATEKEIREAITILSIPFGELQSQMVREQLAWREALSRPLHDHQAVRAALSTALDARKLNWKIKQFNNAWDAWVAREPWVPYARAAWRARAAWVARATRGAWRARDAWGAWDRGAREVWRARDAWGAWDARDALFVFYAGSKKWTRDNPSLLTIGMRDAYKNGLALATPTGPSELGYAIEPTVVEGQGAKAGEGKDG